MNLRMLEKNLYDCNLKILLLRKQNVSACKFISSIVFQRQNMKSNCMCDMSIIQAW